MVTREGMEGYVVDRLGFAASMKDAEDLVRWMIGNGHIEFDEMYGYRFTEENPYIIDYYLEMQREYAR
jgi:hypothetical protein